MTRALEMAVTDAAQKIRQAKEPNADLLSALAKLTSSVKDLYSLEEPKKKDGHYEEMMAEIEGERKERKKN